MYDTTFHCCFSYFLFLCRNFDEQVAKLTHLSEKLDKFSDLAEKVANLSENVQKLLPNNSEQSSDEHAVEE